MGRIFSVLALLFLTGCVSEQWTELKSPLNEQPGANLPLNLRYQNWTDRAGSGSCVIASSCSAFEWNNQPLLAEKFRRTYAGGQTEYSIARIYRANNVPFIATTDYQQVQRTGEGAAYGDPAFLEWVSQTRRMAIIWYFPSHCVNFCGFGKHQGREVAWLLDNNRRERFIPIPKEQFIREWRSYGGFAAVPLWSPAPSRPFQGFEKVTTWAAL